MMDEQSVSCLKHQNNRIKSKRLIVTIICIVAMAVLSLLLTGCKDTELQDTYDEAFRLIEDGKYAEAYACFYQLGDYKDAREQLKRFHYISTSIILEDGEYSATTQAVFNENNLPVRFVSSSEGYSQVGYVDHTYDENGDLTMITTTYEDGKTEIREYVYDENRNVVRYISISSSGGSETVTDYTYDASGRLVTEIYTYDGGTKSTTIYSYDEKGNLIKEESTYSNSNKVTTTDYTYDEYGNLTKEFFHTSSGTSTMFERSYDENRRMIKEVFTYTDGTQRSTDFYYAGDNLIKEVITYQYGIQNFVDYSYDSYGNLLRRVYTYYGGDKESQEYEYDDFGNRIKATYTYRDGEKTVYKATYAFVYIPYDLGEITAEWIDMAAKSFD